jgi:hypothetical protein
MTYGLSCCVPQSCKEKQETLRQTTLLHQIHGCNSSGRRLGQQFTSWGSHGQTRVFCLRKVHCNWVWLLLWLLPGALTLARSTAAHRTHGWGRRGHMTWSCCRRWRGQLGLYPAEGCAHTCRWDPQMSTRGMHTAATTFTKVAEPQPHTRSQ